MRRLLRAGHLHLGKHLLRRHRQSKLLYGFPDRNRAIRPPLICVFAGLDSGDGGRKFFRRDADLGGGL